MGIYTATTEGITVTAHPVYIDGQSDIIKRKFVFAYFIRIANNSDEPVRLMRRHWFISDAGGEVKQVEGEGVVGRQPLIAIIVVVTLDVVSVRSGDRVVGLLGATTKPPPRLIINRYRPALTKRGGMLDIPNVLDILCLELIGIVPEEENIIAAGHKGQLLTMESNSPAAAAFTRITRRILGERIPV